jgi:HlyD family secretion protein
VDVKPTADSASATAAPAPVAVAPLPQLPAVIPPQPRRINRRLLAGLALLALAAAAGGGWWWTHRVPPLPAGIAFGNGRLEADPIDVATKFAGRIAELKVDEGDMVKAGQTLALMDTRDLQQSLEKAQAEVRLQQKAVSEAEANLEQIRSQALLAEQQMERTSTLLKQGWTSQEVFDQRRQQVDMMHAGERASAARINQLQNALQAAQHNVELLRVNIADNTLVAPRDGRIQYRIANVGEVLPAGGKVFTLLDVGYLYMDIYLPTAAAGRVRVGHDARIVVDAYPAQALRAKVTFVSPQAQFTPKMVETQTERDKMMFRVRVRIDPDQLQGVARQAPSGLPGVAYVRFDDKAEWPATLQGAP